MNQFAQQLINGLSAGAIYALIAVGYTLVYGVLRLINFAHGDIYMVGAMIGLYTFSYCSMAATPSISQCPTGLLVVVVAALAITAISLLLHLAIPSWRRHSRRGIYVRLALCAGALLMCPFFRWSADPLGRVPSWISLLLVVIIAMLLCAGLGALIERLAYRPLRNRPRIESLITAIGVSMFLEFGGQSPYVFGPSPQAFPDLIPGMRGHAELLKFSIGPAAAGEVVIGRIDAIILVVTLVLMVILWYVVMRTRTGLALRAVSHRFDTAALMGVNVDRIVSFTFMLGSALAAIAGILVALRSPQVDPLMGFQPGLKAFVAAVLGGIGSVPGAVAGGLLLGITEVMVKGYLHQGSQYADGVAFVILIAVLLVKPSGLFGTSTIEKV